jgi:hypothetical protein
MISIFIKKYAPFLLGFMLENIYRQDFANTSFFTHPSLNKEMICFSGDKEYFDTKVSSSP